MNRGCDMPAPNPIARLAAATAAGLICVLMVNPNATAQERSATDVLPLSSGDGPVIADSPDDTNDFDPVEAPAGDDQRRVRVVLIGNTLIEREQRYGYWETMVLAADPATRYQFRNLGWSGDTVTGDARAGFGTPRDGYNKLIEQVRAARPDVVIVGYGSNASFAGPAGIADFETGMNRMLNDLSAGTRPRLVLLSPPPWEDVGLPGVDVEASNRRLAGYAEAIEDIAVDWRADHVDLFRAWASSRKPHEATRTDNGLHLSATGYWQSAAVFAAPLAKAQPWRLRLTARENELETREASGTTVIESRVLNDARRFELQWSLRDGTLPPPPPPQGSQVAVEPARVLQVLGLAEGKYELLVDRQLVASGSAADWAQGVAVNRGPDFAQVEELRSAVIEKNSWFFHRWRPQNETYLFGFRKHEQGENAREIPQFDPLVAQLEEVIFELSQPRRRYYTLRRQAEGTSIPSTTAAETP